MSCCENNALIVYRGSNNTRFLDCDWLNIKFQTKFDLTNFSAKFKLGIAERNWDTLVDGITINLTEQEIAALPDGLSYANLVVFDNEGHSKPFSTSIPVFTKVWVEGDQRLEQYHMSVDAKFEGETIMTITIETAKVSEQMVDDKIAEHNESEEAHTHIQQLVANEMSARELADNTLQANINTEAQIRAEDDASLGQSIAQETQDRISDVASLNTDIQTKQPKLTSVNAGTDIEITEVGGIVKINSTAEGVTVHNQLTGRDANNAHPISAIGGLQEDLDGLDEAIDNHIADKDNPHEVSKEQVGLGNVQNIDTTNASNITSGTLNNDRLDTIPYSKLSGVASSEQGAKADSALQESDIIDNTSSTDTDKALSANMGKDLADRIENISSLGRYLSTWICPTGLAGTNPPHSPFEYRSGDYFLVSYVAQAGQTNYRPSGTTYTTGVASTVVETDTVVAGDRYLYDGTQWILQKVAERSISFNNVVGSPYDNANLAAALNGKQALIDAQHKLNSDLVSDTNQTNKFVTAQEKTTWNNKQNTISDLDDIRSGASAGATALQSGDNITELTNNADYITSSYHDITKQDTLVSGTNIKTVNNNSLVGSGNVLINEITSAERERLSDLNVQYINQGQPEQALDLQTIDNQKGSASYGFEYSTSFSQFEKGLVPQNRGLDNTYAYAKLTFNIPSETTLTVTIYQGAEGNYDYGTVSNLDQELSYSTTDDSTYKWRDKYYTGSHTIDFGTVTAGTHFITFKYKKDGSAQTGIDLMAITEIKLGSTVVKKLIDYDTEEEIDITPDLSQYAKKTDLNDFVTLSTEQKITNKKKMMFTESYPPSGIGGQESILKILSTHTNTDMNNHSIWCGRLVVGNKNQTFLMGVSNDYESSRVNGPMCGLGAHSWSDAETDSGASWQSVYLQPDGNQSVYLGGNQWRANSGWFKVTNSGSGSASWKATINTGTASSPTWRNILPNMNSAAYSVFITPNISNSSTYNYCTSLGYGAIPSNTYATNIGYNAKAGSYGIAIGQNAVSTGSYAIQIGQGTNSTANTMNVGLSSSLNVQLLNSSGKIPNDRLNIDSTATSGSQNPISSDAVYSLIGNLESLILSL